MWKLFHVTIVVKEKLPCGAKLLHMTSNFIMWSNFHPHNKLNFHLGQNYSKCNYPKYTIRPNEIFCSTYNEYAKYHVVPTNTAPPASLLDVQSTRYLARNCLKDFFSNLSRIRCGNLWNLRWQRKSQLRHHYFECDSGAGFASPQWWLFGNNRSAPTRKYKTIIGGNSPMRFNPAQILNKRKTNLEFNL